MVEPLFVILWLFLGLFFIANIVLVIWGLVDAIKVPDDSMYKAGNKLIWVLVILLAGFVGATVYFAVGRPSSETRAVGPLAAAGPPVPPPPPGALS
jgi:Phospholipase_D-nuclease N-terminal